MCDAPLVDRVLNKVSKDQNGCWLFTGAKTQGGYGRVVHCGRPLLAHRITYATLVGPIPDGLVIDHLCRVRNCVNPEHLRAVTDRENILAGTGATARHARQTHCLRGHELSDDNVYVWRTSRLCRTCRSDYRKTPERKAKDAAYDKARWAKIAKERTHV